MERGGMQRTKGKRRLEEERKREGRDRGMDGSVYADWFPLGRGRDPQLVEGRKERHWGRADESTNETWFYDRARD